MSDVDEPREVEAEELDAEVADALEVSMPSSEALAVRDFGDMHDVVSAMDAQDAKMILESIMASGVALRRWVYDADGNQGLSIHGVQDVVQAMNATAKTKITILPETLTVEREEEATGADGGLDAYWSVTVAARDDMTGQTMFGHSQEPVYMKLSAAKGGGRKFDKFSKTKAIQKAQRNAMAAFIPELIEQTIISAFGGTNRVVPIVSQAEQKAKELAPALDTPEAQERLARADALLDEIYEVGPEARLLYTPGTFFSHKVNAHSSIEMLDRFISYLEERLASMPDEVARQRAAA